MTTPSLQRNFAEFAANLDVQSLPDQVSWAAKRAIIDTLGVMALGAKHPELQTLKGVYADSKGTACLVGGGQSDWETAALVNGMAAHIWDYDDTSYTGIMHASAVILPALLATADYLGSSSDDVLAAFVAGSEVAYTLGEVTGHGHYFRGWWSTATLGLVGATVGVSRLLTREVDVIESALGLACVASSGSKKAIGTSGKPYLVGDAARRAIAFARMMHAGLSGPKNALEGKGAFLDLFSEDIQSAEPVGKRWRLLEPGLLHKRYPVCSAAHAAIDLMVEMTEKSGISADNVESIVAEVPDLVAKSLMFDRPGSQKEAQFCLPYALSCALTSGGVRPADLSESEIRSEAKQRLMQKVQMIAVDDLSTDEMRNRYPESARLKVTLKDGRILSGFCPEAYGMPRRPLSDEDLIAKFASCVGIDQFTVLQLRDGDLTSIARELFKAR
jgi:2-methylcitrate dehydratase PrpD